MKRTLRRIAIGVGVLLLLLGLGAGTIWYVAFSPNRAIVDGRSLAVGVETVKDGFVSAFLVDVGNGKVALVDAGNDAKATSILAALGRRGLGPDAVSAIFLTHGHGDHTAGCKAFPAAQVHALEADVPLVGEAAKVTPLKDGEVTQVGDVRFETYAAPGHTPGSAVYFARGVLFFGDSAGASKDGFVMPAVRLFSKDPSVNVASLKALEARLAPRASEVQALAFAHTGPLMGYAPLVQFAAAH
jgi:glyoxylase-like metal-dependent hydrolase (beta-lactamase superfamily II)